MAQRRRPPNKRQRQKPNNPASPPPPVVRTPVVRKAPTHYGDPFVILEDDQKNTFVFNSGAWIAHAMSIAECREVCQVKELPQKVNGMIRYEIRCPIGM